MFNFGSMFNPLRNAPGSSLSQLLAIPNVSLMRLLDEECFTSQFRSSSSQVRQYMNYKKFEDLLQLVTQVGDPFDKKRSFKFPLTAAELLSSELGFVFEKLIPDEGVVQQQEKIVTTTEREVQQEVEDDEDDEEDLQVSSSEGSKEENLQEPPKSEQTSNQDQEFGDFVQAPIKKKITVKVKEVVQVVSISKKQYPPLVLKIFQYFQKDINYTLTSYCCRILTTLLNKRSSKFFSKLFEKEQYSLNILKHIESRSVVEFLVRLLTFESKDFLDNRLIIFKKVLQALGLSQRIEVLSNISATLCETYQKLVLHFKNPNPCKELEAYFYNIPNYLESTVDYLIGEDQHVAVYSAPLIYHLLTSLPQQLNEAVEPSLNKFVTGAIGKLRRSLESGNILVGPGRVKMVEILNYLLKIESVRLQLSQQQDLIQLFSNLIKAHPLNNILHNQIFKIITEAINSQTQPFTRKIIREEAFLQWLQGQAADEQGRRNNKNQKIFKGYSAHLVNLCKLIKDSSNPIVKQISEDNRFANINSLITDRQFACRSRNLGGYTVIKSNKFQVMSSKQDILKHHATFLSNARPAVFQVDLDDPLQNPTLLEELKRQLDGIEAEPAQEKPEQIIEEEKHKEQLMEENQKHKSAFWKMHIEYDIEQIMKDMF